MQNNGVKEVEQAAIIQEQGVGSGPLRFLIAATELTLGAAGIQSNFVELF